ncbi:MAG: TonB-dependent receptor [Acidobacteria bacterium]|nr:TonB-dependent receptor [Acidobacteriota bacterium]
MRRRYVFGGLLAAVLLLTCGSAYAQRTTAALFGMVKDSSGAVVPSAAVELTNEETGIVTKTAANEIGEFTLPFIPIGRYTVKVEASGFKTFIQKGLILTAGQQSRFPVTLEVGQLSETTIVTAEAPLLQNATVTMSDNITRTQLMELPLSKRDFSGLLALQNGVTSAGSGTFSINGMATAGITVTVDGVDSSGDTETNSITMFQGFNQINVLSLEAIQEVVVSKGVISAEVGRTYAGNFNIISRGGTNDFHGSLFENVQNDVFNARYIFASSKPVVRFNQFGGSLGGPVIRNKAFFFFAYEGYRQSSQSFQRGLVPTPEFKAQAIAAVPGYKAVLDLFPLPNEPYAPGAASGLYSGTVPVTAHDNHLVVRGDYQIRSNDQLTLRWTHGRPYQIIPRLPAATSREYVGATDTGVVTWTHSAASWTSEFRFGANWNDSVRDQKMYGQDIAGIDLQSHFGADGELLTLTGHHYSFEEVIAKTSGRHTIKYGGSYFGRAPGRFDQETPIFRYGSPADFLANKPNRVQFTFGVPRYYGRTWETSFFFQDDFKVRPNLTLNLGVRYEYYSVFQEKNGLIYNPGTPKNAVSVPPVFRPADSIYNADKNNILPRVGFAWGLGSNQETVLRGGFGMSVAPQNLRNFAEMAFISPEIPFRFRFTGSDITDLNLKYPMNNAQGIQAVKGKTVARGLETFDQDNPNPYTMQWTLDVQRRLTPTMVMSLGYAGNKGLKITMRHNYNLPDRITNVRPFPQSLEFAWRNAGDMSWYHGMQVSLRKRFSNDFGFNMNYAYSKGMAIVYGDFWPGNDSRVQDEDNQRADIGILPWSRLHEMKLDAIYQLPLDRWLGLTGRAAGIIGGWQFSGIFGASTGSPLGIQQSSAREFSRPDRGSGDPYLHPSNINGLYLNKDAFIAVPLSPVSGQTIRPGNVGRNSLRGPNSWNLNLNLAKSFQIMEGVSLQVRAEMFNALNHANWGGPVSDIRNANFGRILSASGARSMQLGFRLSF